MEHGRESLSWSPRVPKVMLRRLYRSDAEGLLDEELLDEVGLCLYLRCRDILAIHRARAERQVRCPQCDREGRESAVLRKGGLDETLTCPICGWTIVWRHYLQSVKRRQLNAGGAISAFATYLSTWEQARSPTDKMLAIDRLIHAFHYSLREHPSQPTRPAGVNLIAGNMTSVIAFLNELSASPTSEPRVQAARGEWDENMEALQNIDWRGIIAERRQKRGRSAER